MIPHTTSANDQELEVKFYIADLKALETRLMSQGALLLKPRVHEVNLRFDTPDGDLRRTNRVLRLRQDTAAHLTYKGPGEVLEGVRLRQELEFEVGDFSTARALIEALGYQVDVMYEKYRTTYSMGEVLVTLDKMPYGNFTEIEGPDGDSIRAVADALALDWEARILDSYMMLFERVRSALGLEFQHLSFENFATLQVPPQALQVRRADIP
jgi:adenylate cyclase, class 2